MFHRLSYNNWDWDDQSIYVKAANDNTEGTLVGALIDTNIVQTYKSINDI